MDEIKRFISNLQNQLAVAICKATDWKRHSNGVLLDDRWSVPRQDRKQERNHSPRVRAANTRATPTPSGQPTTTTTTAPATQMLDTVPPAKGEAVEYARKDLTKDVRKFLKANQKAEKSETELGEFDDDRSSPPTKYGASHPSNNTGRLGQTTCKCGNAANGTGGEIPPQGSTRRQAMERGYCQSAKFAHQTDNE